MTFTNYVVLVSVVYFLYYFIIISLDIIKQNRMNHEQDGKEVEIDISQAVAQYKPVDAGGFIEHPLEQGTPESFDDGDLEAGLDEPPEDWHSKMDADQGGGGESVDNIGTVTHDDGIGTSSDGISLWPGLSPQEFKELVRTTIEEGCNYFEGMLVEDI